MSAQNRKRRRTVTSAVTVAPVPPGAERGRLPPVGGRPVAHPFRLLAVGGPFRGQVARRNRPVAVGGAAEGVLALLEVPLERRVDQLRPEAALANRLGDLAAFVHLAVGEDFARDRADL